MQCVNFSCVCNENMKIYVNFVANGNRSYRLEASHNILSLIFILSTWHTLHAK